MSTQGCDIERAEFNAKKDLNAEEIATAFERLNKDTSPEELNILFNKFCLTHFGAEADPLIYEYSGGELAIEDKSEWLHISERSAALSWSTNLPAKSFVKYGKSESVEQKSRNSERYYYTHLHYLNDLEPDSTYYFQIVSIDERGNRTESDIRELRTKNLQHAILVPDDLGEPPFKLNNPGAYYLVTQDIHADGTVFNVEAEQITIDLGGNTVTHGNKLVDPLNYEYLSQSGVGIRKTDDSKITGLRILNGVLKQGRAENNLDYHAADDMLRREPRERYEKLQKNMGRGFSNIELSNVGDVTIAGITAEYRWHQTWGMRFDYAFGKYDIHHNIFLDKGTQMFNRHGDGGSRSLGFRNAETDELTKGNQFRVHHNLVKRTRQNALNGAQRIYNNEIYIDSWVVNSFAISPFNNHGEVFRNKIFMTGYYGCGILWAEEGLKVSENLIHMESVNTMINPPYEGRRLIETWGEQDVQIGIRLTNYGTGGQERKDFVYKDNVIFGRCRGRAIMRGTALYSDHSVENFVLKNNKIKILSADNRVEKAACVVTQGANNDRSEHLPMFYKDSILESDICNVRFGDEYGRGSNHRFINCKIVKRGEHPNYHTFIFDGGNSVFNHVFLDCEFLDGAAYSDVFWRNTQSNSNYRIDWTLNIETEADSDIAIEDKNGELVYSGSSDDQGKLKVELTQSIFRPVEWQEGMEEQEVQETLSYQEEKKTPYTVFVNKVGEEHFRTVEMTKKQFLKI